VVVGLVLMDQCTLGAFRSGFREMMGA